MVSFKEEHPFIHLVYHPNPRPKSNVTKSSHHDVHLMLAITVTTSVWEIMTSLIWGEEMLTVQLLYYRCNNTGYQCLQSLNAQILVINWENLHKSRPVYSLERTLLVSAFSMRKVVYTSSKYVYTAFSHWYLYREMSWWVNTFPTIFNCIEIFPTAIIR